MSQFEGKFDDFGMDTISLAGPLKAKLAAMKAAVSVPVTVKCRIGVDDQEPEEALFRLVDLSARAGVATFIVHARKAWLSGLSPKENREIPPLRYDTVYRLKQEFPSLTIVINGGIHTMDECLTHLKQVDGVMLGREVYENPYRLAEVDSKLFGDTRPAPTRVEVVDAMYDYIHAELEAGNSLPHITRHMLGLYRNQPGGKQFRR
eukprot:gene7528-9589_t